MQKVLFRARDRFDRDQRGNVAILFAFAVIPLIGLLGGAVDVTRHARHKTALLNAMDAAAIALVRSGIEEEEAADRFVNDYIAAMIPADNRDPMLEMGSFDAVKIDGGYRVISGASMHTAFLPVVGIDAMSLDLQSEVLMEGGNFEVALALDNTGSMRNYGRIQALRDAAGQLVDDLYSEQGAGDRVKMALVPFVTAVNINSPGAIDIDTWIEPIDDTGVNYSETVDKLALFDRMGVPWRGCVEARRGGHDEDDTPPTSKETRWLPYLWPDEPDDRGFNNSYLEEEGSRRSSDWELLRDVRKYEVDAGTRVPDRTNFGPNAACARAIVPLTNDTQLMQDEIELMKPHNETGGNNSGTNVAQGLVWAWRVLSPEAPYDQGAPYDDGKTQKVLVLLSDGRNQIVANNDVTESDYTSYGYLAEGRLGSNDNYLVAEREVDAKVGRICEKIKTKGIRLYTILFQVDFARTQDLFRACASNGEDGQPLFYYVPDASQLETAFKAIGEDLTSLRIAR